MTSPAPDLSELVPIRRVAAETGIRETTLRAWERRYGRPKPVRLPSGQRRYSWREVYWIRQVAELLAQGARPKEVLGLTPDALARIRKEHRAETHDLGLAGWIEDIKAFRARELEDSLRAECQRLGLLKFLEERVRPLLREVGAAWAEGRLAVRHEHFASEVIEGVLRTLELPPTDPDPPGLLAALAGETHTLPLLMVGVVSRSCGVGVRSLGVDLPAVEVVGAAREVQPRFVGITVSLATGGVSTDRTLSALRQQLPAHVDLVVGGAGARRGRRGPQGITYLNDLHAYAVWLSALS